MLFLLFYFFTLIQGQLFPLDIGMTAVFQNEGPYLKEWIDYHHMIGVEHFWLYHNEGRDDWQTVLEPYIEEGLVEVIEWPSQETDFLIYHQVHAVKDALKRAKGTVKWLAILDIDEFILPMKDKNLTECIKNHFSEASAIFANWRMFGTSGITVPEGDPILFELEACSLRNHADNFNGKSIVKVDDVAIDQVWFIHHCPMNPDARYFNGDGKEIIYEGQNLKIDNRNHDKYIRINHYRFRDEHFFHTTRMERWKRFGHPEFLLWEAYEAYNLMTDSAIKTFITLNYPEKYKQIWK